MRHSDGRTDMRAKVFCGNSGREEALLRHGEPKDQAIINLITGMEVKPRNEQKTRINGVLTKQAGLNAHRTGEARFFVDRYSSEFFNSESRAIFRSRPVTMAKTTMKM